MGRKRSAIAPVSVITMDKTAAKMGLSMKKREIMAGSASILWLCRLRPLLSQNRLELARPEEPSLGCHPAPLSMEGIQPGAPLERLLHWSASASARD